ncbi:MAG: DUF5615 family PIN-like protein [Cyclobacteriaceae bacterium]|nr:DUF5615 family PIN-like protein [Cyclobacteriaceae bacterium]
MKLLFDQNISHKILKLLPEKYKEATSVKSERMLSFTDREIWEFARKNNYVIVTHDSDFNDLNALFGFPPKIIWIRTGNIRPKDLADLILQYEREIAKFISEDAYGCFEIFSIP